ncbi:hypothetical protein ACHAWF_015148 [Thalassiosira exigua]
MARIHGAAQELARAFRTLGAFGESSLLVASSSSSSTSSSLSSSSIPNSRHATYADLTRKYAPFLAGGDRISPIPNPGTNSGVGGRPALLDALVGASSLARVATVKADLRRRRPWSLLEAAYEGSVPVAKEDGKEGGEGGKKPADRASKLGPGRRVGESFYSRTDATLDWLVPASETLGSAMQNPALQREEIDKASVRAAQASRKHLARRHEMARLRGEMESAARAVRSASRRVESVGGSGHHPGTDSSEIQRSDFDPNMDRRRVVAQLGRQAEELRVKQVETKFLADQFAREAERSYCGFALARDRSRDPYRIGGEPSPLHRILGSRSGPREGRAFGAGNRAPRVNNLVMDAVFGRQYRPSPRPRSRSSSQLSALKSRLSHAATISCHLVYPVYCLKFDKTGEYFITGADDQVVKLFHLGAGKREAVTISVDDDVPGEGGARGRPPEFNYGANARGAVLVCSLRGHAGVVADIDVSADNSLLATASGDGDVRIWGLRDGFPVAILRGHKNGANMVSWSTLTPYRLVTCGEDGLARMWDVRKAAMNKYSDLRQRWSQYSLPKPDDAANHPETDRQEHDESISMAVNPPNAADDSGARNNLAGIGLDGYGDFVFNNRIDKGVSVIAQFQHGSPQEDHALQGRVTRTTGKPIRVMCIARCPVGGHFATGTDDGLGHVWADDDDWIVEFRDRESSKFELVDDGVARTLDPMATKQETPTPSNAPSKERLLATLRGHRNPVTDLEYSKAGDRILTGSLKDGVVCIWSWGKEGAMTSVGTSVGANSPGLRPRVEFFGDISQLVIELSPASQDGSSAVRTSKQKSSLSASSHAVPVNCDGVAWTCDDTKVVTSQSSPAKASSSEIIPDSHMLYVWDSHTGKCLIGIKSSHSSPCSAVASHPTLPSVFASAGADGVVKVWDLERGDCFFTHKNALTHGPVEPGTPRAKLCGYLDVQFSPDGLKLVLTDENGRVTILDTLVPSMSRLPGAGGADAARYSIPAWMSEQYFANDYYDLRYDVNGYCVERGSGQPPHLAPEGVRCNHEGMSYPECVRAVYKMLEGPLSLPESLTRWGRDDIRSRGAQIRAEGGLISHNTHKKARKLVRGPEPVVASETTAIITTDGKLVHDERKDVPFSSSGHNAFGTAGHGTLNASSPPRRQLSSRYRWSDFNDLPESEDEHEDEDDEEFVHGSSNRILGDDDLEEDNLDHDDHIDDEDSVSGPRPRRRHNQTAGAGYRLGRRRARGGQAAADESHEQHQPARASSRQTTRRTYQELFSDDEELYEMLSTHTEPTGNFSEDWTESQHLFKMPRGEGDLARRKWLSRTTYQGLSLGRKRYCPQVGDSVIYIPRAHDEVIKKFPVQDYLQPWNLWPKHSSWPVVRCSVLHVRYRFPYEVHYKTRAKHERLYGVAAVLTLKVSGVPSESSRNYPWPGPTFLAPAPSRTRAHDSIEFEVTVFECDEEDFILPEYLYSWRIKELERAITANGGIIDGLPVKVYCAEHSDDAEDDIDYTAFDGRLVDYAEMNEEKELHFVESGFNSLCMKWESESGCDDTDVAVFSPWNIVVPNPTNQVPVVPKMGEEARKNVKKALNVIKRFDPKVRDLFLDVVNTDRYIDYLEMVEVPMNLSLIQKRLLSNYYTNKNSVVADMELVRENCYKYNEDGEGFHALACEMHDKFKSLVDAIEDLEGQSLMENLTTASNHNHSPGRANQRPSRSAGRPRREDSSQPNSAAAHRNGEDAHEQVNDVARAAAGSQANSIEKKPGEEEAVANSQKVTHEETGPSQNGRPKEARSTRVKISLRVRNNTRRRAEEDNEKLDTDPESPAASLNQTQSKEASPGRRASQRARNKPRLMGQDTEESPGAAVAARSRRPLQQLPANESSGPRRRSSRSRAINAEESELGEVAAPRSRRPSQRKESIEARSPSRRVSRRARSIGRNVTKEDSEESDTDEVAPRTRRSSQQSQGKTKTTSRRIARARGNARQREEDSDESDSEESEKTPSRPSKQSRATKKASNSNRRVSARSKGGVSYLEKDSDDEEFVESSSEEDEQSEEEVSESDEEITESDESEEEASSEEDMSRRKRKRGPQNRGAPQTKRSRVANGKVGPIDFPDLPKWPSVSRRRIPRVGVAVLALLREADYDELFHRPVCEDYPDLAKDYLQKVKNPMDFRTIEEERLDSYEHIAELQEDLILAFRNCCVYNEQGHEYTNYAIHIWQSLNEVFEEAQNLPKDCD